MRLFLVFLFFMSIPFAYAELLGVRVLFFQVLLGLLFLTFKFFEQSKATFYVNSSALVSIALWCLVLVYSLYTGYFNELLALTVFLLLVFITSQFNPGFLGNIILFYKCAVLFTAVGVLVQFLVHRLLGVELFRYQLFGGGRNAYSFIWDDYSFIALFIVSGIPLFFDKKINFRFLFASCFLLVASVTTSARTGVVAFVLFVAFYVGVEVFKSLLVGRIKKVIIVVFFVMLVLPVFLIMVMENLTGREVTGSSSGRIDDFFLGLSYLKERFLFGFYFDKVVYNDVVSAVPHNVFIYMLYMGGGAAFVIFMLWFFLVVFDLRFSDKKLMGSLLICLLGFQFIPSFFSAYFLAVLLGAAFVSGRHNQSKITLLSS